MIITPASPCHAPLIGRAIVMAITPATVEEQMGPHGVPMERYRSLFSDMAARDDTQYSWLNTLVATDPDAPGAPVMGLIIGYDGARLHELRAPFLDELARRVAPMPPERLVDECSPDEYYLDTLAVWPEYRRRGVGAALLRAAAERGRQLTGKPAGLLVDKANTRASRLYHAVGFRYVGDRPFFGEMMDHLQMP